MVQTTTVSIKGSNNATIPSEAANLVLTALWAIAAEPTPASLENAALLKPCIKTPIIPPVTPEGERPHQRWIQMHYQLD